MRQGAAQRALISSKVAAESPEEEVECCRGPEACSLRGCVFLPAHADPGFARPDRILVNVCALLITIPRMLIFLSHVRRRPLSARRG